MNHIDLFDSTALKVSQLVTERYSTSFTLGIKTLHKKFRDPVFAIYGFVRYADEIVDTFHDHNKKVLLERFRKDTYDAIDEKLSFNPILHSFQSVVNQYKIENELIDAFLHSMEMDILQNEYNESGYQEYIYGSAEVVGLMCLRVFCEGDDKQFQSLKAPARRLGAAFQKVNFLRDIKSDFKDRGRTYFPGVDFNNFSQNSKNQIEEDIQDDFDAAYEGIKRLPKGARLGVYLAYVYYLTLFSKIKRLPVARIMTERIRIPDSKKIILLFQTYLKHSLNGF
ncbi:MAG: phytoene/squalene synthase family protein [Imperialibacter sp.]|uniref:phytoene/squalene synthase family protein n=1 Tax=Imperialibacter sp. TaxID=2038411 RepID=UPI0032EAE9A0